MTEPVPGQTPEPAVADDATTTPPTAREPEPAEPDTAEPDTTAVDTAERNTTEPGVGRAEAGHPEASEPEAVGAEGGGSQAGQPEAGGHGAANPQELFGSLSLSAIEADIDRLMSDKMSQLDGMLAGLEDLVQRLEGEITNLETTPDEPDTPKG